MPRRGIGHSVTLRIPLASADGCTDSSSQVVCIDPDVIIYVPNAFTPTEDGLNDVFIPVTVGVNPDKYEFWVFDRWGNLIFYTDELDEGWDGKVLGSDKLCQIDTYVWKIKCTDVLDKRHDLIGHVNLIR
jgi:gliding motility-associated-like protein